MRAHGIRLFVSCSLWSAVFVACGGSSSSSIADGGAEGGSESAAIAQACAASAQARCARLDTCTGGFYTKLHYGDAATCEARLSANCVVSLGAADTGQSPAITGACTSALPNGVCDDLLGDLPAAACAIPAGTRASGAACAFSAQCASTYCAVPSTASCGACAAAPAAGDTCAVTAECGARGGLYCNTTSKLCTSFGSLNAPCNTTTLECGPGLFCVGSSTTQMGTCETSIATLGASCDPTHKTGPGCDPDLGLFCSTPSSTCTADPFGTGGQPCGVVDGVDDRCGSGGLCIFTEADGGTASIGVCAVAAADGAACDTVIGPTCLSPARCVVNGSGTAGTCALLDPTKCN